MNDCNGSRDILEKLVEAWVKGDDIVSAIQEAKFYLESTFIINYSVDRPITMEEKMSFKDFLNGENISPICACNTCEHIYQTFKKVIAVNADVSGTEIETLKISVGFYKKEIERLKEENKKLLEVVKFYADIGNECCGDYQPPNKAREALKELENEE